MTAYHKELAAGRWSEFSLAEQLGNVGSEISRAINWRGRNQQFQERALDRALELLDLTTQTLDSKVRLKELLRVREALVDAILGGQEYGSTLEDLNKYFLNFAYLARKYEP
jgi:hypothetical protein